MSSRRRAPFSSCRLRTSSATCGRRASSRGSATCATSCFPPEMRAPAVRLVSAPWVVPIDGAPIREGAVALDARGTIVAVGPRRALLDQVHDLPEDRGDGALLPGLV